MHGQLGRKVMESWGILGSWDVSVCIVSFSLSCLMRDWELYVIAAASSALPMLWPEARENDK